METPHKHEPSPYFKWSLVILVHFITTAIFTWPLVSDFEIWHLDQGALLYSYIFGWDWHALTTNPLHLFDANIYYPATNSLTSSDNRLGILILWVIPWLITHRQFIADGVALLLVYALTGVTLHIWVRHWTNDHISAALAAMWINFNPFRMFNIQNVHLLGIVWAPLVLLALDKYLTKGGRRWWALMVVMFWLQFNVSFYISYAVLIMMAMYFLLAQKLRPVNGYRRAWLGVIAGCIVLFITLAPMVIPYMNRTAFVGSNVKGLIIDSPRFPKDFLISYSLSWLWSEKIGMYDPELIHAPLWFGLGIPLLCLIGFLSCFDKKRGTENKSTGILFIILSVFMFTLGMGPYLKLGEEPTSIPLPFLVFMKFAPGFDKMIVPYRFFLTTPIIWAPLLGMGIARIFDYARARLTNFKRFYRIIPAALSLFLLFDLWCRPLGNPPVNAKDEPRELTKWLAQTPIEGGILELPFSQEYFLNNALYMIQSLHHFRPIMNGYGSFHPYEFASLAENIPALPDEEALLRFAAVGIRTYILHLDMLDFMRPSEKGGVVDRETVLGHFPRFENLLAADEETVNKFAASPLLTEIKRFPKDIIYYFPAPLAVSDKLSGDVSRLDMEISRITVFVRFSGSEGKAWRNIFYPASVEFRAYLEPAQLSGSMMGPWKFSVAFPLVLLPGEPIESGFYIDNLPPPGSYNLKIISSEKTVEIKPVVVNFEAPPGGVQ